MSQLVTALRSESCITASARKLESGDPISVPETCLQYLFSKLNSVGRLRLSKSKISCMCNKVLLWQEDSFVRSTSVSCRAVSSGIEGNREATSKEPKILSGST